MKAFLLAVWEIFEIVAVAVATVFLIRAFLVQPFLVSGASMEPSFGSGNYLIIDEITYRFREPQRGEVIVFKYPENPSTYYIKRIVGLPDEKIEINKGFVYVSDLESTEKFLLKENYLSSNIKTLGNISAQLDDKEYYVLGDNRGNSYDSRSWGKLDKKYIIGLVRLRIFPLTQFEVFTY